MNYKSTNNEDLIKEIYSSLADKSLTEKRELIDGLNKILEQDIEIKKNNIDNILDQL